ncbi:MAG TPA: helix-turn-helix transcriptional regulator, partial [Cyanobacteria bacterium UBA11049]|nr:helix-turn-helix transcriptional regulator [Cyanobacteria bacterium UBA11049]
MAGGESQSPVSLSERELQIIDLVAAGLTNQEIAEKLEISKRTV